MATNAKPAKQLRLNLISSITDQGLMRLRGDEETLTVQVLIEFRRGLMQGQPKTMFLILDHRKVPRSQAGLLGGDPVGPDRGVLPAGPCPRLESGCAVEQRLEGRMA